MNDEMVLSARKYNVKFCMDIDSRDVSHLDFMKYGIGQAKKGWMTSEDIINTYTYSKLRDFLDNR
ncbi:MAG: hypothetical protein ACLFMM_06755 [Methanohalobium sp.]|uniref:hypothetical protein n=1 Tax=Methanohalobium sp. TaxID=2837493 RepID=UPI00397B379A